MEWFRKKKQKEALTLQTAVSDGYSYGGYAFLDQSKNPVYERRLYQALRENIPVIDAAVEKLIRLIGSFHVRCRDKEVEQELERFLQNVRVNGCQRGIDSFLQGYMDDLITYGTAAGEMVLAKNGKQIAALYNASLDNIELTADKNPLDVTICAITPDGERVPVKYPALVMCTTMMNESGKLYGTSLLRGLPFVGELLMKILYAIGTNWDRVGNVRFAVSYKPGDSDRSFTKERAAQIASEWSKAMKSREPKDFVTVGDVSIKVIGADNQIPEMQVPVRILLEQILSKLSIPPFLLGFSWSSTERMSSQQADILTSELEYYRGLLSGVIRQIVTLYLKLRGAADDVLIEWDNISLQDEVELARAGLLNAQAEKLRNECSEGG